MTVKRTEMREQFFAEARTDPYTHTLVHMLSGAWADGYEQALRDAGLTDERLRKSHSDRRDEAVERMTDNRKRAEAQAIIAMAQIGPLLIPPSLGGSR